MVVAIIGKISHSPAQLLAELGRAALCVLDTETTGLGRTDRILSVGVRTAGTNHILFTSHCCETSIRRHAVSDQQLRQALEPLSRPDLVICGHNLLPFDALMLRKEGIEIGGEIRDTLLLLRLLDQDRGRDQGHGARLDLRTSGGPTPLNYRLKDIGRQLCGIKPMYTPSTTMQFVPYRKHTIYLAHDLAVTEAVYEHIWPQIDFGLQLHYRQFMLPVATMLLDLTELGAPADEEFIARQARKLAALMDAISAEHARQTHITLDDLLEWPLRKLLYKQYKLPVIKGPTWKGSVDAETISRLAEIADNPQVKRSLELIAGHRRAKSLLTRLVSYRPHIVDGRIHASFSLRQATGRVSSHDPNLQQLAKAKKIMPGTRFQTVVQSRNLLAAPAGRLLVGADLGQADVRVLAHEIASCSTSTDELRLQLLARRLEALPEIEPYRRQCDCVNPDWPGGSPDPPPEFVPGMPSRLVDDFRIGVVGDFYARVASNITGRTIADDAPERDAFKTLLLGLINGMTTAGLRKRLRCTKEQAKSTLLHSRRHIRR